MVNYKDSEWELIRLEKSKFLSKKYDGILRNKKTNKEKRVPFGSAQHQHYKDTGLGIYTPLDHLDETRRDLFYNRFKRHLIPGVWNSAWLSAIFLW